MPPWVMVGDGTFSPSGIYTCSASKVENAITFFPEGISKTFLCRSPKMGYGLRGVQRKFFEIPSGKKLWHFQLLILTETKGDSDPRGSAALPSIVPNGTSEQPGWFYFWPFCRIG